MRMMTREEGAPGRGSSRGMPNTVHERQFTLSSVRFGFVSCLLGPGGCALRHVMVVASKCLDVERGRILSDSVTSRSGSVGRALTARDSSLRYASCALSAAQNSVPGPGPPPPARRERHGPESRRTMRGQSNRALPLPRPGGARLRPSRCRVRVPRRPRSFTITWTKEMLPQCPPVHVDHVVRHRDMFIFYLYLLSRLHLRPNSHDHSM